MKLLQHSKRNRISSEFNIPLFYTYMKVIKMYAEYFNA